MTTLLSRQFTVDRPLEQVWLHLARAERWPTWAKHIRQVELQPPGEVGPNTTGRLTLSNGVKSTLTMTEFNPQRNWKWAGRFLWLMVYFDHCFEELTPMQTKLTWIVEAKGSACRCSGSSWRSSTAGIWIGRFPCWSRR